MNNSKNQKNHPKNTYLKYFLFGVATLIIVSLAASFFVENKLKNHLENIAGLSHQKLNVSILSRRISVHEIQLEWNDEKKGSSKFNCQKLVLAGISWWNLIKHNNLTINKLTINKGEGKIKSPYRFPQKKADTSEEKSSIENIFIKNLFLKKTKIDFTHQDGGVTKVEDLDFHIHQLHYAISPQKNSLNYNDLSLSFANAGWTPREGLYSVHCGKWDSKMSSKNLSITDFELRPLHSVSNWKNHIPHKKARLHLKIPKVELMEIDYQKLLAGEGFSAENLSLHEAHLDVVSSKEIAPCAACYKAFIHEKLLEAKFPIDIKKVELKENKIHIVTANEQAREVIDFSFENIFASIYNVTNVKERIKENAKITADIKALFAGESNLETKIIFFLNSSQFNYQIDAKLDQLDLTKLNKILDFGSKVKVESGHLDQLDFSIKGDNQLASGNMQFAYQNLKIKMLNDEKNKVKKLLSGLANLGLKNNNQKSKGKFREGKIYYPRTRNHGIFHQWFGAIQSGFKSTILPNLLLKDELEK